RRLTVTVPAGLPVGPVSVHVTNRISNEVSDARSLDIVSLALPDLGSATPGATGVVVRIAGSPNSRFAAGTRASFGLGITVRATTVESATSLLATIDIASSAAIGPRDVAVISTTQHAVALGGFAVAVATPINQRPVITSGVTQTITLPAGASLSG